MRVERRAAARWSLQEAEDALARLGRRAAATRSRRRAPLTMSSLRRRAICDAAGEVDRAQLDRRAGERAHDGAGVGRVGEQAQPGEHVADLGALRRTPPRRRAGRGPRAPRAPTATAWPSSRDRAHQHARSARARRPRARSAARSRPRRSGPGRARSAQRQNATSPPGAPGAARLAMRSAIGATTARGRVERRAAGQRSDSLQADDRRVGVLAGEVAQVLRRGAAGALDRLVVVAGGGRGRRARRRAAHEQQAWAQLEVLDVVDEHVRGSARRPARATCGCSRSSASARSTRSPTSSAPRSASIRSCAA